jgi:hypothetical protein
MTVPPQNPQGPPDPYQPPTNPGGYGPPAGQPDPYGPPPVQPPPYGQPTQPGQYGPPPTPPGGAFNAAPGQPGQYPQAPGQYPQALGQPGPYGPPPVAPGAYGLAPGVPVKSKSKGPLIRGLVILAVIAVAVIFAIVKSSSSPDSSQAGDCLAVSEFKQGAEPDKAACDDPKANVKIGVRLDDDNASCPTGDYDEYSVSGSGSYKLCLIINAKQGECFSGMASSTAGYTRVSCTDPASDSEFVKVVNGTSSEDLCKDTEATRARTYSQPPTTLCYKQKGD